ncbi:MAG: IS110 family transposase [Verrucomicrobiae bacterium]|nr:IS110 family transposase [Verrucomicrobiae bacterium]MCP5520313.1 IS110 family transposase [Verrucomicrobiales bacterium]
MNEHIAFDSHKSYTLVEHWDIATGRTRQVRLQHQRGVFVQHLQGIEPKTPVAVEASGNWYWIIGEIEEAGGLPQLVHPRKAKLMMGLINKTDKLDVHGLNRLQQNQTLPTVWIPSAKLRDQRELTRGRLALTGQRTRLKNRLQAILTKHGRRIRDWSDPFGRSARQQWESLLEELPEQTRWIAHQFLSQLDFIEGQIKEQEARLRKLLEVTPMMQRLQSLPGVGLILAATIALEIGDIARFASAERLASYAGTTPRVHASGDKVRYGRLRPDVNRYLKWAYVEAANSVALNHQRQPDRHVSRRYRQLKERKGHPKAIGAVARHLAEASFHVLSKDEDYCDPALRQKPEPGSNQSGVNATTA